MWYKSGTARRSTNPAGDWGPTIRRPDGRSKRGSDRIHRNRRVGYQPDFAVRTLLAPKMAHARREGGQPSEPHTRRGTTMPDLAGIVLDLVELGPRLIDRLSLGRLRSKSGQAWSNPGPNFIDRGLTNAGCVRVRGPSLAEIDQTWSTSGQMLAVRIWPKSAPHLSKSAQIWPNPDERRRCYLELLRTWAQLPQSDRCRACFGQLRPGSGQCWGIATGIGPLLGHTSACCPRTCTTVVPERYCDGL